MIPHQSPQAGSGGADQWNPALPPRVPRATFAPAFLALGITFLLFGIVSSYIFSAVGLILMVWSVSKWIAELIRGEAEEERSAAGKIGI
jgi:hypothetical protein